MGSVVVFSSDHAPEGGDCVRPSATTDRIQRTCGGATWGDSCPHGWRASSAARASGSTTSPTCCDDCCSVSACRAMRL
eukprot:11195110-Lingulodinium_polyedra.AAC.1